MSIFYYSMIDNKDIEEYIELCKVFGGSYDLVQTNGGNISVKSKNLIIIKRSGFKMIETELNKGYVICDINKIDFTNENIEDSVVFGEGTPSIETFFHLLPKKYIVHLHPIKLVHLLSLKNWSELILDLFDNVLCINYKKPGLELSKEILNNYNNEEIIFLQNHGIILCSNTKDEIYNLIYNIFEKYNTNRIPSTHILFMKYLYNKINNKLIISSYIPWIKHDRYFFKLTPDILLYLGNSPYIFETDNYTNINEFDTNVIIYKDVVYLVGNNYANIKNLEEMVKTYYLILECGLNDNYHEISKDENDKLKSWDKEVLRLK